MGRPKKGWTIRWRTGRDGELRFTHQGKQYNIGLGTRDRAEGESKAPGIYAEIVSKPAEVERKLTTGNGAPFEEVGGEWLGSIAQSLRERTRGTYEVYLVTLARHFKRITDCTTENIEAFMSARLSRVLRSSVKHEMSALKRIVRYAHGQKLLASMPYIPPLPDRAKGTKFAKPRRVAADSHSDEEIVALINALPEWSKRAKGTGVRHPIRARFILAYLLPIRPATIDVLEVPTHWSPERLTLWVPDEDDKIGNGRELPLPPIVVEALRSVAPERGTIFGHHDYREVLRAAALKALPKHKAERFCGQHLRSAGGTHLLDVTRNDLVGVQFILGHRRVTTTARYMRTNERAGARVIELASRRRAG